MATGIYQISVTVTDPVGLKATDNIEINVVSPSYLDKDTWSKFKGDLPQTIPTLFPSYIWVTAALLVLVIATRRRYNKK